MNPGERRQENRCSFCGKGQSQVRLIAGAGPGVFICSECVALCNEVLAHDATVVGKTPSEPTGPGSATGWVRHIFHRS